MKKKNTQSKINTLMARKADLEKKISAAFRLGMSQQLVNQLNNMLDETNLNIFDEIELEKFRRDNGNDSDSESFIV